MFYKVNLTYNYCYYKKIFSFPIITKLVMYSFNMTSKYIQYFSHKIYKLLSFVASLKFINISALTLSKSILALRLNVTV